MKKLIVLIVIIVGAAFIYSGEQQYTPYENLRELEAGYGIDKSFMPASEEKIRLLKTELLELQKELASESGRKAEAVKMLIAVRIDLAIAAEKFRGAGKLSGAMSPFSDNCTEGGAVTKAERLMDEALRSVKTASDRMDLFLEKYPSEAGSFGISGNYAGEHAAFLEESTEREKLSLRTFC
jgi:hypothetical protein